MCRVFLAAGLLASLASVLGAQQLRKVPQRFAFVQPIGLLVGIGSVGFEFAVGRRTTFETGGLGVYTREDGVRVFGGGPGVGVRRYVHTGEPAGLFLGARADALWLHGEAAGERAASVFIGLGALGGYRWLTRAGAVIDLVAGYEALLGPRPLVAGSRPLQDDLGPIVGSAVGWSW
ncbi:MAG: hypothetical protein HY560_11585 [Gemmatimonadetes bacterium]|nr:hypothetical protein [Gemmatimonadota bacterium]